jgi:membrane associated rhomboid family serine protease
MSQLIIVVGGCLILAVGSRLLYLSLKRHTVQSKGTSIHFLMTYGGTTLGFFVGFFGSVRFLQTKWDDGSFIWDFIIAWALALIGFFVGLLASGKLSSKTH